MRGGKKLQKPGPFGHLETAVSLSDIRFSVLTETSVNGRLQLRPARSPRHLSIPTMIRDITHWRLHTSCYSTLLHFPNSQYFPIYYLALVLFDTAMEREAPNQRAGAFSLELSKRVTRTMSHM